MPASGMADNLPADLVVLYQDAFAHFDTDNDGIITTKSLGPLLRYCGENPSEAEVQVTTFSITQNTRQIHHIIWSTHWGKNQLFIQKLPRI